MPGICECASANQSSKSILRWSIQMNTWQLDISPLKEAELDQRLLMFVSFLYYLGK
jgi:hypothetical protein